MLITQITCTVCQKTKDVGKSGSGLTPTVCNDCKKEQQERDKQEHLDSLVLLPVEERLRRMERALYEHQQSCTGNPYPARY